MKKQIIINGLHKNVIEKFIIFNIVWLAIIHVRNPLLVIKTFKKIVANRKLLIGNRKLSKAVKCGNRYYWDMHSPGWPSRAFSSFYLDEIKRVASPKYKINGAKLIVFSITNKCSLRCEHCYESDNLGKPDALSLLDLKEIIKRLQERGLSKVGLSGGEPMMRLDDVLEVVKSFQEKIDFWLLTSGYDVTSENAIRLKEAGLVGLSISADHFDADKHNQFRHSTESFGWMQAAVKNSKEAGLLVCLTICATNEFISENNLIQYAEMAKAIGASFIQIVEPRAVGAYSGKTVSLTKDNIEILERFFLDLNYNKKYAEYPIAAYNAYHQRRLGCMGNASRYLFVDSFGNIHPCHFCRFDMGNILEVNYQQSIDKLIDFEGCTEYAKTRI